MILHYNERIEHFSVLSINDNPNKVSNNQNIFNKTKPNFKLIFNDIKDNNKEKLRSNTYVKINDNDQYYNGIYNFLYSKKMNKKSNDKIDWKKVIYPNESNNIEQKLKRDKKKQNFRELADKYMLDKDNVLFIKLLNKDNHIENYKIPYESEKISLFLKYHDKKGHIGYKRMLEEIKKDKYYWKSLRNDCKQYVFECPTCINVRTGKMFKLFQRKLLLKDQEIGI